jgi:cytochrome c oxidase subunit 3
VLLVINSMEEEIAYKTAPKFFEQKIARKYKNYRFILYCSILGTSFMFLSLTFSYFVSVFDTNHKDIELVPLFYWNTIILLASSAAIYYAQQQFEKDNYTKYKTSLIAVIGLALLFIFGQISAWIFQFMDGNSIQHPTSKYLYVISGLHLVHIIGGLIFLANFVANSWSNLKEYATSIVYFTDPIAKSQLSLFGIFWHFLGVIWLYLLAFFLIVG